MIIRLHNLSARAPDMVDARAVARLFCLYKHGESVSIDTLEHDLRQNWQTPGFALKMDAWVIVANKGEIVGYADVQHKSNQALCELALSLCVHPNYLDRGLGTLLIWLVEERARQLMHSIPAQMDVMLVSSVSSLNEWGRTTFTREGYMLARRFLRLVIAMEEVSARSLTDFLNTASLQWTLLLIQR